MKIAKVKEVITITHRDKSVRFEGLPAINRKKQNIVGARNANGEVMTRDDLLFVELERYWTTLTSAEQDQLYETYDTIAALSGAEPETVEEYLPGIVRVLDSLHKISNFKALYPMDKVWIPEKLQENFDSLPPNYPREMTYIRHEYYEMLMYSLTIKAYVPLFNMLGAYINGKGLAQETKRKVVYNMIRSYNVLHGTDLSRSPAIPKLKVFLDCLVEKFQKESNKGPNGTSLSVLASVCGYGSDMLEEYQMAFTAVFVLGLHPVGADYGTADMNENNTISQIFYAIRTEVEGGFASRISGQNVLLKQHPVNVVYNGEKGKVTAIDLIEGREDAPPKEPIRGGISMMDYRRFIKRYGIDVPPSTVKTLIDSILTHHNGPTYELHEWLVASVIHRFVDCRSFKDIHRDAFKHGMAIAQAVYLHYGMHDVARLLSCTMIPGNMTGHPIQPIDNDIKIKMDRYYPHAYKSSRGSVSTDSTPRESLNLLLSNHIAPYYFNLNATEEAAALLQCEASIEKMRLGGAIQTQLAEMLTIQARNKLNEVDWFNS